MLKMSIEDPQIMKPSAAISFSTTKKDDVDPQVTARAVSALSRLIPLAVPLVRSGGELLFLKGANVAGEVEAATKAIRKAHLLDVEVLTLGENLGTETTRVFRATVD